MLVYLDVLSHHLNTVEMSHRQTGSNILKITLGIFDLFLATKISSPDLCRQHRQLYDSQILKMHAIPYCSWSESK